jgi:hypothetical protein
MSTHWIIIFCLGFSLGLQAQTLRKETVDDADEHFRLTNYLSAIPIYQEELKEHPDNIGLKYRLGLCYLNCRINRQVTVNLLEEASTVPDIEADVWLHLGRAYHLDGRIEEAITAFEKFASLKPKRGDEVEHYLEQCQHAIELMRHPLRVSFQNLGPEINSPDPDYYPFIDKDEVSLVFTSRRKENFGGRKVEVDGYRSSDIYLSNSVDGKWSPARNAARALNGSLDEQCVGLRPDGLELYVYMDHIETYGDLYVAKRTELQADFLKPKIVTGAVNKEIETAGCMTEDGSLIFFTRRSRLKGKSDLYMSRRLPNGQWSQAQALPSNINTPYNEDMPYLSYDGSTLYFVSEGHNSMGGCDIFKTTWDATTNTFSDPVNLGFPINSTDDDRSICMTRDNKLAYVSSFRPEGFGDLDLYRVKFDEEEPINVIYTGKVILGDSVEDAQIKTYDVKITVTDVKTNYEYLFVPQSKTGHFVMALPAGDYRLTTFSKGYARHKEEFTVSDMGKINLERKKNLILARLKKDS